MKKIKMLFKLLFWFPRRPMDVLYFLRTMRLWEQSAQVPWRVDWFELKPMLKDRKAAAGSAKGHYFLQDIWAARQVFNLRPERHVDVGSRVDGFVANVCAFCPEVEYVDIRPMATEVPGLRSVAGSVCRLPFADRSQRSLSCLHVLEHIGLGRYGDPVDPEGWKLGLAELQRVLAPGGQLLIGTPCGRERLVFHAHRVFDPQTVVRQLNELVLEAFAYISDGNSTGWVETTDLGALATLDYGCGLFRFRRPEAAISN